MNSVEKFIYPKNNSFGIITSYLSKTIIFYLNITYILSKYVLKMAMKKLSICTNERF